MSDRSCHRSSWTRRQLLAAAAGVSVVCPARGFAGARVAIGRCRGYGREVTPVLRGMFDQLGGLSALVAGKRVAIKMNMVGSAERRFGHLPNEMAHWTHPDVVAATAHLLSRGGARRIRVLESFAHNMNPLEDEMLATGWDPSDILNAGPNVEMENTGFLGYGKRYHRLLAPDGGLIYPGFDFNHSYAECDVFVSIAKMKEHNTAGVTLTMKNLFGAVPPTIYGNAAGVDEPALIPYGGRQMFHYGGRQPSASAPPEIDFKSSREPGYRVPRIITDIVAARPIHLAIVDGISTITGGEGPGGARRNGGRHVTPGLLIAGLNPVSTDAVATACMGFDPMATRGTPPFENRDSTLELAEQRGIGTRDLNNIEVTGARIDEVVHPFRRRTQR